jgi:hypothetical protein
MSKIELPPLLLDFSIEPETPTLPRILTWSGDRGCRPATSAECELWDAIRARDRQIVEVCAARIEQLRDEHCAATQQAEDRSDHCHSDGSDGCEFVAAWNDAIAAIRNLIEESNNG